MVVVLFVFAVVVVCCLFLMFVVCFLLLFCSERQTRPFFYIMVEIDIQKDFRHPWARFRLIAYKGRRLLQFQELPYAIKVLVLNRCMEHNCPGFYHLVEFQHLKQSVGMNAVTDGRPKPLTPAFNQYVNDLFDESVVFEFSTSASPLLPCGLGARENIGFEHRAQFLELQETPNWRQKLDDDFVVSSSLMIDGSQWMSVTHFVEAGRFQQDHPDFYREFCVDSHSAISKDPAVARMAASESGKNPKTGEILRRANISPQRGYDGTDR